MIVLGIATFFLFGAVIGLSIRVREGGAEIRKAHKLWWVSVQEVCPAELAEQVIETVCNKIDAEVSK